MLRWALQLTLIAVAYGVTVTSLYEEDSTVVTGTTPQPKIPPIALYLDPNVTHLRVHGGASLVVLCYIIEHGHKYDKAGWRKEGYRQAYAVQANFRYEIVSQKEDMAIKRVNTTSMLEIPVFSREHEGSYKCRWTVQGQPLWQAKILLEGVYGLEMEIEPYNDTFVELGSRHVLRCTVSHHVNEDDIIFWEGPYPDLEESFIHIQHQTHTPNDTLITEKELVITSFTSRHHGRYTCRFRLAGTYSHLRREKSVFIRENWKGRSGGLSTSVTVALLVVATAAVPGAVFFSSSAAV